MPGSPLDASINDLQYSDLEGFLGIKDGRAEADRPAEGQGLDYKQDFSDSFGDAVAAFANAFGGTLILGVQDNYKAGKTKPGERTYPVGMPGIPKGKGELKTRIVNKLQTSVYPMPELFIQVLASGDLEYAVVKVAEGYSAPYFSLSDTRQYKIPVRHEDTNQAVTPLELEGLLQRRKRTGKELWTRRGTEDVKYQSNGAEQSCRLAIIPARHLGVGLDLQEEKEFNQVWTQHAWKSDLKVLQRTADWSEFEFLPTNGTAPVRVRLCSDGSMWTVFGITSRVQEGNSTTSTVVLEGWASIALRILRAGGAYLRSKGAARVQLRMQSEMGEAPVFTNLRGIGIETTAGVRRDGGFSLISHVESLGAPHEHFARLLMWALREQRGTDVDVTMFTTELQDRVR